MNDYIKRDEALSFPFANGKYDHKNANEHFIFGCESYKEWLENLPTADVRENVRSKWVDMDVDEYYDTIILRCGNCGDSTEFFWYGKPSELMKIMRFCPRCGARMKGENEK